MAVVQTVRGEPGEIVVVARAGGLDAARLVLRSTACELRPAIL